MILKVGEGHMSKVDTYHSDGLYEFWKRGLG